ncbi:MAG: response regulator [Solirubrobacterales bacterium]
MSAGPQLERIRVALADDSYLVREAVSQILARHPRIDLVAVCVDRDSLLAAVESERPEVVITDIRMPPTGNDEGIQIASQLRRTHPEVGVVVLSQYAEPSYGLALLQAGSDGRAYMLKERVSDQSQLIAAIDAVAHGGSFIDAKVVEALIEARGAAADSPLSELTPRELEILGAIAQGKSNGAIGEELFLSKRAVEKHINSILLKLELPEAQEVSRRVMATLIYLSAREGSLPGTP